MGKARRPTNAPFLAVLGGGAAALVGACSGILGIGDLPRRGADPDSVGDGAASGGPVGTPDAGPGPSVTLDGLAIATIVGGDSHTCALTATGLVACWGRDDAFQLGHDPTTDDACVYAGRTFPCASRPTIVQGLDGVVDLAAGVASTCALRNDGTLWCWGLNDFGQLGHNPAVDVAASAGASNSRPIQVAFPDGAGAPDGGSTPAPVAAFSINSRDACAVLGDGSVWCWGDDQFGQLGNGAAPSDAAFWTPTRALVPGIAVGVAVGYDGHACAWTRDDEAYCWGRNTNGQIGHAPGTGSPVDTGDEGTTRYNATPQAVAGLAGITTIVAGDAYNCALQSTGVVACWGWNGTASLGQGAVDTTGLAYPTPRPLVGDLPAFVELATTSETACARTATGAVYWWGTTQFGQGGDGSGVGAADAGANLADSRGCFQGYFCNPSATLVTGITATALGAANHATFEVLRDGRVFGVGNDFAGQLGHVPGTAGDQRCTLDPNSWCNGTPAAVPGLGAYDGGAP